MSYPHFAEMFPWVTPMAQFFAAVFLVLLVAVSIPVFESRAWSKQKEALKTWRFDDAYKQEVMLKYPHLTEADVSKAFEQLRLYFGICWRQEKKTVAMPSRIIDECWHVFICDTRSYAQFCEAVFGQFLHHQPPNGIELQKMPADARNQLQMLANARAFLGAVHAEKNNGNDVRVENVLDTEIVAKVANLSLAVPVMFSIDERLRIQDGFCYEAEFLASLAAFDVKKAEAKLSKADGAPDGSGAAACGDGGTCGCGGSV